MSGAHTNHNNDFITENIDAEDVPIFNEPTLPDQAYIPFVVAQDDPTCGGDFLALYHLPMRRLTPGGTLQSNTHSVAGNGYSGTVPAGQVIPAFVTPSGGNPITLASAEDATHLADFLVLSKDDNIAGNYIVQNSGFYVFPEGHGYAVGLQYYLSNTTGQVSTTPGTKSQKLFRVIDAVTISINIG